MGFNNKIKVGRKGEIKMNHQINRLIHFALQKGLITEWDVDYSANLLVALFKLESFEREEIVEKLSTATPILETLLDYAVEIGLIEGTQTERDLFDNKIMNCVMPRPSEVISTFRHLNLVDPKAATDYYYQLSIASNYIRKDRTDKNIRWTTTTRYGNIEISINLSKPEKDPKDIARALQMKTSNYPTCLLCKENVGFAGDFKRDARVTHRIVPLKLNGKTYYLQYSPYVYYNEHCIIFNEEHTPMKIGRHTFENLLAFINIFPHYMVGSNADLPIVGGSILTHDHYQGGCYHFPMQDAKPIHTWQKDDLKIQLLSWPLTTIRVQSKNKQSIVDYATQILERWMNYTNETLDIISHTDGVRHNTITPIARKNGDLYEMDLVLRNNRTSEQYPDGIFHPHQENHHIKKENIGLIEVMGLAVLPARLKQELQLMEDALLKKINFEDYEVLEKHRDWYEELKHVEVNEENVHEVVCASVSEIFTHVLEDAGVFKLKDENALKAICEFIEN